MILWVKRAAALLNIMSLTALFSASGELGATAMGGIVNLAWAMSEKIPFSIKRSLSAGVLIINTGLAVYGVLKGGPAIWAVLASAGSLLSWNAGLFWQRWIDPVNSLQIRYLKRIAGVTALGVGTGLSALAFQRDFSLPLVWVYLAMFIGGVLLLRLLSRVSA